MGRASTLLGSWRRSLAERHRDRGLAGHLHIAAVVVASQRGALFFSGGGTQHIGAAIAA
jgi:hypothetical protein